MSNGKLTRVNFLLERVEETIELYPIEDINPTRATNQLIDNLQRNLHVSWENIFQITYQARRQKLNPHEVVQTITYEKSLDIGARTRKDTYSAIMCRTLLQEISFRKNKLNFQFLLIFSKYLIFLFNKKMINDFVNNTNQVQYNI